MAYTVGSASVDIVPDFKNAQLAITAFFNKQRDDFKIPVKLDISQAGVADVERDARIIGSRVSKAMADGAASNQAAVRKAAVQAARDQERALTFAHGEALKIQAQMDREAARVAKALLDQEARERAAADREIVRSAVARAQEVQRAHVEALRIQAQMDRDAAKARADADRLADQIDQARDRSRIAAHREAIRINQQMDREAARARETFLRDEERAIREHIKAQIRAMKEAQRTASKEEKIRLQVEIDEKQSLLAGRSAGGLVTRAMREELRQNAGLITGAIYGVLTVGAPLAIGAAVALFAGIGGVAAAQSERVRSTYVGLWDEIKAGATADAESLVPVFERSAGQIGQSFQRMRPLIREAFEASGPHVDSFTSSILKASENALPGLVRAVSEAGPTVSGLGDLLEKTGTGVGEFFSTLATHSFAAGNAASSLGDTIEALLPTLAELLGQGAETASIVLPAVTGGFRVLNNVVSATGDLLPRILTAFLAFRAIQGVGRTIQNWGISLGVAAAKGGAFSGTMSRASSVMGKAGAVGAVLGTVFGLIAADAARSEQQINEWTQTLMRGGEQAARLQATIAANRGKGSSFDILGDSFGDELQEQFGKAEDAAKRLYDAMTPLERAQHDVDVATRALQEGMDDEGTTASELTGLKRDVAEAAARQAREEEKLERATKGVTEAMVAQADAARARVDSSFGYQQSLIATQQALLDVTQAQTDLDEARASGDPAEIASAELSLKEALLGVNDALSNQVKLAGDVAISKLPASMSDAQKSILGAKAELEELNRVMAEGTVLPPELEQYRQKLIDIVNGADGAMLAQAQLAEALREVGIAVEEIPGTASVKIDDNSPEVIAKLESLGFQVTELPDGQVKVTPVTQEAHDALGDLSNQLTIIDTTTAVPTVNADTNPFAGKYSQSMRELKMLGDQNPTPTISARDFAGAVIRSVKAGIDGLQDKTITLTTVNRTINQTVPGSSIRSTVHTGGAVADHLANNPRVRYDRGGAVRYGDGGPWDDLVDIRVSPGEHVFDYGDVVAMGGQEAVYEFRKMLHSGYFQAPGKDTSIKQMVTSGAAPRKTDAPVQSATPRSVALYTPDIPAALRELKAMEHQEAALAPVWP